jgi:DNA-binding transcriptional LysR family regulator
VSFEVERRFAALEKLVNQANQKGLDEEQASHLSKLGSVLVCGNIERCVEILVTSRFASNSPRQVASFMQAYFKRGTNYDCDAISQLLHRFDGDWGRKFEQALKQETRTSVSSCYAVRNSVAHGGGMSLGPRSLKQYFLASFDLIAELEKALR